MREEKKESYLSCALSNCPKSHLSSQVQCQSYHAIRTISQALPISIFLCCSVTQACLTLCDSMYSKNPRLAALQIAHSFLKPMTFESVMLCSHLVLCPTLLLLPQIPPRISVFFNESTLCMRWPEYWSFSFSISPSNEHPGLISFSMQWLRLFIFLTQ